MEHYLARQIMPDINFTFNEFCIKGKRIVALVIPAAKVIPTAFNGNRFIRIGSSKVNLNKFPERESKLFDVLRNGLLTMENTESYEQELTFRKLFLYYEDRGLGESVSVNRCLSDIFLQLHISERSGRGVPVITQVYGKEAFEFRENSIVVTIPFEKILSDVGDKVGDKDMNLNPTHKLILKEMRNNPNITQLQLMDIVGIRKTAIQNNISYLRKNGYIKRIGSNKNGYWEVL